MSQKNNPILPTLFIVAVVALLGLGTWSIVGGGGDGDTQVSKRRKKRKKRNKGTADGNRQDRRRERRAKRRGQKETRRSGRFRPIREGNVADQIAELEAIGYVSGSRDGDSNGVTVNEKDARQPGLNFYVSGDQSAAVLMDADGNIRHRWTVECADVYPDRPNKRFLRRAKLLDNGDIIALWEGVGMVRLDVDSNLKWKTEQLVHHDATMLEDGTILALTRKAHIIERVDPEEPVLEDYVSIFNADTGKELRRVSVLEALENSEFAHFWNDRTRLTGDVFHTNAAFYLDGSMAKAVPAFKKGNVLVSSRILSALFVVDMQTKKVVWAHTGSYKLQHDPRPLANGNILVFDNKGLPRESRILEINPVTSAETVVYRGDKDRPFFSALCGTAHRLANGNTLINETDGGRSFEVDSSGRTVWEFMNPARAGDNDEFIASMLDLVRVPHAAVASWLDTKN